MSFRVSIRRIAALLCYAASVFAAFVLLADIHRHLTHGWGYSVVEDLIVFTAMTIIAVAFGALGYFVSRQRWLSSLYTVLIATTLVAAAFGLMVWNAM